MSRYVNIANETSPDLIIRITADCLLIRPHLISECISYVIENEMDYCSLSPDFAEGVDVEVLTVSALDRIQKIASNAFDREHVTYALPKNQSNFKVGQVQNKMDHSHIRLTLDHPVDYKLLQEIFKNMRMP